MSDLNLDHRDVYSNDDEELEHVIQIRQNPEKIIEGLKLD